MLLVHFKNIWILLVDNLYACCVFIHFCIMYIFHYICRHPIYILYICTQPLPIHVCIFCTYSPTLYLQCIFCTFAPTLYIQCIFCTFALALCLYFVIQLQTPCVYTCIWYYICRHPVCGIKEGQDAELHGKMEVDEDGKFYIRKLI